MQIFYCSGCRSRVTSNDLDVGQGVRSGADVYCAQCARSMKTEPETGPETGPPVGSAPAPRRARPAPAETAGPQGGRNLMLPIAALGGLIAVLAIVLVVLLLKKPVAPEQVSLPPQTQSYSTVQLPASPSAVPPVNAEPPGIPAVVPPAVEEPAAPAAVPGLPERGTDRFPSSAGYSSLLAGDWEQRLQAARGAWQSGGGMLTAAIGGEHGAGIIRTAQWQGNYELGLRLAVQKAATIEVRLNEQKQGSARCTLMKTASGTWHVLTARVNGAQLESLELNGNNLLAADNPSVRVNREDMPANGAIRLIVNTADFEESSVSLAEFALKKIEGAAAGNMRTLYLLNTDKGDLFKDGTKGVPENPPGADTGQYVKVVTGEGGWAGMWDIPESDWSAYTRLAFDYYNPESTEYTLTMKFGDAAARAVWAWDEGAYLKVPIGPGFGRAEAPLAGMKNGKSRAFDLAHMEIWHLLPDNHTIYVRNIRLEADLD